MSKLIFRISLLLLVFTTSFPSFSFENTDNLTKTESIKDKKIGKRKRNVASPASKRALQRQPKHIKSSIKRNDRRNKKMLKHRSKKQKRQHKYSKRKTFR